MRRMLYFKNNSLPLIMYAISYCGNNQFIVCDLCLINEEKVMLSEMYIVICHLYSVIVSCVLVVSTHLVVLYFCSRSF